MNKIIELQRIRYSDWNSLKLKLAYNAGLRVVILNSMGTDPFPVEQAKRIGLRVYSLPDYCSSELSDHAFKLMGNLVRQTNFDLPDVVTVLVVGSQGNVGKKVVEKCVEREFIVLKHDIVLKHARKDLEKAVSKVNVVFVCVPVTKETSGMFDLFLFRKTEENSPLFINVSGRMVLFKKNDLLSALKLGLISGYACDSDVSDRRFYMHHKMFFTPHVGWKSIKSERKRELFLEELWQEAKEELNNS